MNWSRPLTLLWQSTLLCVLVAPVVAQAQPPAFRLKWGAFGTGSGQFRYPGAIAVDAAGNVYVSDTENSRIQKFTGDGTFITSWGSLGTGNGQFNRSTGIAVDVSGNVFVADEGNNRIQKFTTSGTFISKWGAFGTGDGQFRTPWGVTTDPSGNVYVVDRVNNRIQKFNGTGTFITKWGSAGSGDGQFNNPRGIVLDASGDVYVSDQSAHRMQKFTNTGTFITKWGGFGTGDGFFGFPFGLAVEANGDVLVADRNNDRIQEFTSAGTFLTKWGSFGTGNGNFDAPEGIAINALGDIYVVEAENHRVQKFGPVRELGDNPLGPLFTYSGRAGVTFDVVPKGHSGTFTLADIPAGATVQKAFYITGSIDIQGGPGHAIDLTFNGTPYGNQSASSTDLSSAYNFDLAGYAVDVTAHVTGNGSYSFTATPQQTTHNEGLFGHMLVVVYTGAAVPWRNIAIHAGGEALMNAFATSSFAGMDAGPAQLQILTMADEVGAPLGEESIRFNGAVLGGGPGIDYLAANQGDLVSSFEFPVVCNAGANTVTVTTGDDWIGWHAMVLVQNAPRAYEWQGEAGGPWTSAQRWNPPRFDPAPNDVLRFSGGGTASPVGVPTETIGQLIVTGNTTLTPGSSSGAVLTITGGDGPDLDVDAGSIVGFFWPLDGPMGLRLTAGATADIHGQILFGTFGHTLDAVDANSVIFNAGSVFGSDGTTNSFTTSGTPNAIHFLSGSTLGYSACDASRTVFGLPAPASKIVLDPGSLYISTCPNNGHTIDMGGRTFGNFDFDQQTSAWGTATGSGDVTMGDLTVSKGLLTIAMTGAFHLQGNLTVESLGDLNLNPATPATITLDGTSAQTITVQSSFSVGANRTIAVNNSSGIVLGSNVTFDSGTLAFVNGKVTTGAHTLAIGAAANVIGAGGGTGWVVGSLKRNVPGWPEQVFDIGDAGAYTPVAIEVGGLAAPFDLTARTATPDHAQLATSGIDPARSVNRYWTLTPTGSPSFQNYEARFTFVPSDIDAGASPASFHVARYNGTSWSELTAGNRTATSTQAKGVTAFSDFAIGAPSSLLSTSDFTYDREAWMVADIQAPYASPPFVTSTFYAPWSATGGNPSGYIRWTDQSTDAFFFSAPNSYLGNQSAVFGKTLTFDALVQVGDPVTDLSPVILWGGWSGGMTLYSIPKPPALANTWTPYSLPMFGSSFTVNSPTGPPATDQQLQSVLSNLVNFYIQGDRVTGTDTAGLDNVGWSSSSSTPSVSDFTSDRQNWLVLDFSYPLTNPPTVSNSYVPMWSGSGGNPGGYIHQLDPSSALFYFAAPSGYLGNQSGAFGQTMTYDLQDDLVGAANGDAAVILRGATKTLYSAGGAAPGATWTPRALLLVGSSFHVNSQTGPIATDQELLDVLANLQGLYILGDQINGTDTVGLDNVVWPYGSTSAFEGGLPLSALGAAALNVQPNLLTVSNLGSSGNDGVAIVPGPVKFPIAMPVRIGYSARVSHSGSVPPAGGTIVQKLVGTLNGVPNQPLGSVTLGAQPTGANTIAVGFAALGASTYKVQIYNGTTLVHTKTGHSGAGITYTCGGSAPAAARPFGSTAAGDPIPGVDISLEQVAPAIATKVDFGTGTCLDLGDGTGPHTGTRMMISGAASGTLAITAMTAIQVTSNLPAFRVTDQALGVLGSFHRGRGQAAISASGHGVRAANLGSSGQDGIGIRADGARGIHVAFGNANGFRATDAGASLVTRAMGKVAGTPTQLLALSKTVAGNGLNITADFAAASQCSVIVLHHGQSLYRGAVATGSVVRQEGLPASGDKLPTVTFRGGKSPGEKTVASIGFKSARNVTVSGNPFTATEVQFKRAAGPGAAAVSTGDVSSTTTTEDDYEFAEVTDLELLAADPGGTVLDELVIENEIRLEEDGSGNTTDIEPQAWQTSARISGAPNPFTHQTALQFEIGTARNVQLAIFDVAGRRVRDLRRGLVPAGVHRLVWDGRDDSGREVGMGVYFAALDLEDRSLRTKLLKLR